MIKKIGISNFKAISKYQELNLKNLNLLAGANGVGKSSFYQYLLLFIESKENYITYEDLKKVPILKINNNLFLFGKSDDILNQQDNDETSIKLFLEEGVVIEYIYKLILDTNYYQHKKLYLDKLRYDNEKGEYEFFRHNNSWDIHASNCISFLNITLKLRLIEYCEKTFSIKQTEVLNEYVHLTKIIRFSMYQGFLFSFVVPFSEIGACLKDSIKGLFDLEDFIQYCKKNDLDDDIKYDFIHFQINYSPELLILELNKVVKYIKPFRGFPKRIYLSDEETFPLNGFQENKNKKIEYKYNYENNKVEKLILSKALNYWIHYLFGYNIEKINEDINGLTKEILFSVDSKSLSIYNLGFGTSQILPIIFQLLLYSNSYNLVIIDEPEIHLHPSAQSKLADFLFQMAALNKNLIIETHSEYIIDRLIFLSIKYSKFKNRINLNWINKIGSECVKTEIKFDDLGYIQNLPKGFLDEKEKQINELNQLRLERL
jgi:AAA15 family ATPase/GTPase